jgi:hypothetical protein
MKENIENSTRLATFSKLLNAKALSRNGAWISDTKLSFVADWRIIDAVKRTQRFWPIRSSGQRRHAEGFSPVTGCHRAHIERANVGYRKQNNRECVLVRA